MTKYIAPAMTLLAINRISEYGGYYEVGVERNPKSDGLEIHFTTECFDEAAVEAHRLYDEFEGEEQIFISAYFTTEDFHPILQLNILDLEHTQSKPTFRSIHDDYLQSDVCMGELLADTPADGLTIEEAFELYMKMMKEAEGDVFYRQIPEGEVEEIAIKH